MAYDYGRMRRLSVDPKMIEEIQRSPRMSAEQQGAPFLGWYGGLGQYQVFSRLPMEQRLVYAAVLEGHTTPSEVEVITGLSPEEVSRGLGELEGRGLVSVEKDI